MTGIDIEIAEKRFPAMAGGPERLIFRDFRLKVPAREQLVLLGASGLGKTTLLNMVAGLDTDFKGRVSFDGGKPHIGYAFQSPRLLPWRTVLENVALPLPATRASREAARAMLAEVGLAEHSGAYPERLSLGQQRRVALARAFVIAPDVLLMDEPFVSLDEANAFRLRELLRALLEKHPATVMFVTHDRREAQEVASRIVSLEGTPARIARDTQVDPAVRFDAIRRNVAKK